MIEVSAALKGVEELDKAVGIIAKLAGKLKAKPDLAAQKLREALGEVAKTLTAVDNAVSQFMSLGMAQGALTKDSQLLLHIEGGNLSTEVERGRGHCHLITQIYSQYLDKWFEREFKKDDYDSVEEVFRQLGYSDAGVFCALDQMVEFLEREAKVILDLVLKGEEANARTLVLSAWPTLRELRKTISKTMQTLYSMQSEFVEIAGAA